MPNRFILKLLTQEQWDAFRVANVFNGAPVDIQDGYIHFSTSKQVEETAAKYFSEEPEVILAQIDTLKLLVAVEWEPARGGALFPHLYSELPMEAVVRTAVLSRDDADRLIFPDWAFPK